MCKTKLLSFMRAGIIFVFCLLLLTACAPATKKSDGGGDDSGGNTSDNTNYFGKYHTATLLQDGRVLVTGSSCKIYNPATDQWSQTGNLNQARFAHSAVLLANGKVLAIGGKNKANNQDIPLASCEIYDPATEQWSLTGSISMPKDAYGCCLLADGRVLLTAGNRMVGNEDPCLQECEIYDPATGLWELANDMGQNNCGHTLTLLLNGGALMAGEGCTNPGAVIYNPNTNSWNQTGSMIQARQYHTATRLSNGNVLVAGGNIWDTTTVIASCEIYNSTTGQWAATGSLNQARTKHMAILLQDNRVLVIGGRNSEKVSLSSYEVYTSATGTWNIVNIEVEIGDTATLLNDGRILIVREGIDSDFSLYNI